MLRATAFSAIIGVAMCLLAIVAGEWLLRLAFGPQFVAAYGVMVVLLGVPLVAMISFPWPAMLHALNRAPVELIANGFGVLVYVAGVFPLVDRFGLIGAGIAFLLGRIAKAALMGGVLVAERRRLWAALG
jgi:O-antigen/teichoic acid export membrane protein